MIFSCYNCSLFFISSIPERKKNFLYSTKLKLLVLVRNIFITWMLINFFCVSFKNSTQRKLIWKELVSKHFAFKFFFFTKITKWMNEGLMIFKGGNWNALLIIKSHFYTDKIYIRVFKLFYLTKNITFHYFLFRHHHHHSATSTLF